MSMLMGEGEEIVILVVIVVVGSRMEVEMKYVSQVEAEMEARLMWVSMVEGVENRGEVEAVTMTRRYLRRFGRGR